MRRPPLSLLLLTLIGASLGGWMTINGLYIRLFDSFLHLQNMLGLWVRIQEVLESSSTPLAFQLEPQVFAWPLLAIGMAWFGALCALWLRLSWGYRASLMVGMLSLIFLGLGTAPAVLALICLRASTTRRWLEIVEELDAG